MRKKFLGIICLLYSLIITYVLIFDKLKNYLAPTMQIYIKLALLPLLVIGIVLLLVNDDSKFAFSDIVLLLPLVMLFLAGDGRLTADFAKNRIYSKSDKSLIINSNKNDGDNDIKSKNIDIESNDIDKSSYSSEVDFEIVDENYSNLAVYFSFIEKAVLQEGKTIRLKGFITKDDRVVPDGYVGIGKYEISCCAADAGFVGFMIKDNNFKKNEWYEIEGVLEKMPDNKQQYVLGINVISMKKLDPKKENQYVYPCYSYRDGLCGEVTKYYLEY